MKTSYLLHNKYKKYGWILLVLGLIIGALFYTEAIDNELLKVKVLSFYSNGSFMDEEKSFFQIIETGLLDEIISILIIVGGLLVGFTKEKIEDEFIYQLRKDSLAWAIITNYIVLLFAVIFIYNFTFFDVLIFNMFTPLLIFIIRFNFLKFKFNSNEE